MTLSPRIRSLWCSAWKSLEVGKRKKKKKAGNSTEKGLMQMRAQGNTWVWMSFIQRMSVTQPSRMIDKNSGGSWPQEECVCERWGKGQRKVRSQEDTSCAFHNFLRVVPFESIWKISQGHFISRICEDFFFSFNFGCPRICSWRLYEIQPLLYLMVPQTNPQPVLPLDCQTSWSCS